MYFIGNIIIALASILNLVLTLYMYIIIAGAVLSWVNPDPYNPIVRFIHNVTEPVLYQVRRRIPVNFGGIDFSPFIVILVILLLTSGLIPSLSQFGANLR